MNRKVAFVFMLGILFVGCQNKKQNSEAPHPENTKNDKPANVVGGWSQAVIDDDVKDAADFAWEEIQATSELNEIADVKIQIVSGKNYDITFTLENGEKWNVIVYKNVTGNYSLIKSEEQQN